MIGTIIGDVIGNGFERVKYETYKKRLFTFDSRYSDDSILHLATLDTLTKYYQELYLKGKKEEFKNHYIKNLKMYRALYPNREYGAMFEKWSKDFNDYTSYKSLGNGAAMRIEGVGYVTKTLKETKDLARLLSNVTHSGEASKGAEALAVMIYLIRKGKDKKYLKDYVIKHYYPELDGLDLNFITAIYETQFGFNCLAEHTVKYAILCFLESNSFMDALGKALKLRGDIDTICAMCMSLAFSYYQYVPSIVVDAVLDYIDEIPLRNVLKDFYKKFKDNFNYKRVE